MNTVYEVRGKRYGQTIHVVTTNEGHAHMHFYHLRYSDGIEWIVLTKQAPTDAKPIRIQEQPQ